MSEEDSTGDVATSPRLRLMSRPRREFAIRIVIALALVLLAYWLWQLTSLLLLVFAAALSAILLCWITNALTRRIGLPHGWGLFLTIAFFTVVGVGLAIEFGAAFSQQLETLFLDIPGAWQAFLRRLEVIGLGREELDWISRHAPIAGGFNQLTRFVGQLTGVVGGLVLASIGGVYLAAQPQLYRRGLIALAPDRWRAEVAATLDDMGTALRHWLVGQLTTMLVVGFLTGLGAWIIGLPSAVALGVIAALLEFVPYVGPVATAVPALLLAFTLSTEAALLTLLLLVAVQQLEGYLLTPLIQRRAVQLPPAVTLFALFGMGALFGALGVLFAVPLTVCIFVVARRVYRRVPAADHAAAAG
jgi:predicted PurR-regulated permease PerM